MLLPYLLDSGCTTYAAALPARQRVHHVCCCPTCSTAGAPRMPQTCPRSARRGCCAHSSHSTSAGGYAAMGPRHCSPPCSRNCVCMQSSPALMSTRHGSMLRRTHAWPVRVWQPSSAAKLSTFLRGSKSGLSC